MTVISPEVRRRVLYQMSRAHRLFINDLLRGFFANPRSTLAHQVLLESTADTVIGLATTTPEGMALCQTFILELQDALNRRKEQQ